MEMIASLNLKRIFKAYSWQGPLLEPVILLYVDEETEGAVEADHEAGEGGEEEKQRVIADV